MLETVHSPLIEPVTESDLIAILRTCLDPGIELVQHCQITGGLFNTTYYLVTHRPDHEIILRIAPSEQKHTTLFDYEKTMMAAEPAIYALMRRGGVPVPDVLAHDSTGRVINRQVILLRYLDSTPMNDPAIPDEARPALRRQLGAYLRQMHAITHGHFGRVQPDGTVHGDASWRVVFGDLWEEAIRRCRDHDLLKTETLAQLERQLAAHSHRLEDPAIKPALIHGDVWEANVLLQQNKNGVWQIAAIIDADRALFADRMFEAALWDNAPDFIAGYDHPLDDSDSAQHRQMLYQLYHHLFHIFVFGVQIPASDLLRHHRQSVHHLLHAR